MTWYGCMAQIGTVPHFSYLNGLGSRNPQVAALLFLLLPEQTSTFVNSSHLPGTRHQNVLLIHKHLHVAVQVLLCSKNS